MIRIVVNLDVGETMFGMVKDHSGFAAPAPDQVLALSDQIRRPAKAAGFEVAFFFRRQPNRQLKSLSPILAKAKQACAQIQSAFSDAVLHRFIIVDCGDTLMQPLSDFTVISLLLETIREELSPQQGAAIFALDLNANRNDGAFAVRDIRAEAFAEHMVNHSRAELALLNINARKRGGSGTGQVQ